MATPAQFTANHQNSLHSTGPRTEEGKRASCMNAIRHGLTSQLVVLPTEDHAAYTALSASLLADLKPEGATEVVLVHTICDTHWRLERARKIEGNILALAQFEPVPLDLAAIEDASQRASLIEARAYLTNERQLRNLQHHEARLQRTLFKTMDELQFVQNNRRTRREELLDQAACTKIHHKANNLPFDPVELGFVFTDAEIDAELKRLHVISNPRQPFPSFDSKRELPEQLRAALRGDMEAAKSLLR